MEIVRLKLSAAQIAPLNTRHNEGTDTVQFSPDNGTTWIDVPTLDPRTSLTYQLPASPTSNPKCDAAERAIAQLHDEIDGVLTTTNSVQLASYLFDLIAILIPGFGIVYAAVLLAASALLSIGSTAVGNAFTDAAYATLKCLWFNRVGGDGIMTPENMLLWQDDIQADTSLDAAVATVISIMVDKLGLVQLNNAAVVRGETGDCSTCGNWVKLWQFDVSDTWPIVYGQFVSGVGYRNLVTNELPYTCEIGITVVVPSDCVITHLSVRAYAETASRGAFRGTYCEPFPTNVQNAGGDGSGAGYLNFVTDYTVGTYTIYVQVSNLVETVGTVEIYSVEARGSGTEPTW